jgi:hypothetical protein
MTLAELNTLASSLNMDLEQMTMMFGFAGLIVSSLFWYAVYSAVGGR